MFMAKWNIKDFKELPHKIELKSKTVSLVVHSYLFSNVSSVHTTWYAQQGIALKADLKHESPPSIFVLSRGGGELMRTY